MYINMEAYNSAEKVKLAFPDGQIDTVTAVKEKDAEVYHTLKNSKAYLIEFCPGFVSFKKVEKNGPSEYLRIDAHGLDLSDLRNDFIPGFKDYKKAVLQLNKDDPELLREIITPIVGDVFCDEHTEKNALEYVASSGLDKINEMRLGNPAEKFTFLQFYDFLVKNNYLMAAETEKKPLVNLDKETGEFIFKTYKEHSTVETVREIMLGKLLEEELSKLVVEYKRELTYSEKRDLISNLRKKDIPLKDINRVINSMRYGYIGEQEAYRKFRGLAAALEPFRNAGEAVAFDLADDQLSELERKVKASV